MKISADYHTHTKYSHGKGTILENVIMAKERGLKQIAITDHGFGHVFFPMKRRRLEKMRKEAAEAEAKTGVKVLIGTEANLLSFDGHIDCRPEDNLDLVVMGFHKAVWYKPFNMIRLGAMNILREMFMGKKKYHKVSLEKKWVKKNTQAIINAVRKNNIDILSHPNRHFRVDVIEVAKACKETNTIFELNAKSPFYSKEVLKALAETGVNFVVNSDAHKVSKVGDVQDYLDYIEGIIPEEQILNINGKIIR